MKSLDNLIRYLLEEIALCGDYGAETSDFIAYVNRYYTTPENTNQGVSSTSINTSAVDRKFLEKVWTWLTRHEEIEVGEDGWGNRLSLSEVERRNASLGDHHPEELDHTHGSVEPCEDQSVARSPATKGNKTPAHRLPKSDQSTPSGRSSGHLRLYSSIERRWQAIAGHAPDPVKIPRLDFACLSIIAVHGPKGILQPDLVRISQQDKRSVPERTRRLHDGGYISKVPILINKSHTSKLILQRYVKEPAHHSEVGGDVNSAGQILRPAQNSTENEIDFLALQRKIFDVLREFKLITCNELKEKLGIIGLRWPMRLLARNLRRLEFLGCIKQVRAYPVTDSTVPFLFRCVKYIRDPEGKEWEPMQFPSRKHSKQPHADDDGPNALSDDDQEYDAEEALYLAKRGGVQQLQGLTEIERPVPQWSGDSTLSNLLFDLVHASGRAGMSTMDLKNRSMGCFIIRPTENHISRLVEMWQMSQPLHLRHLAIIRDAALTAGIPHYVHYSFENFKKLVEEGKASWESVMTVTKDHKDFKTTAAIEAEPELDENGFPKLASTLFQGRYNDASLVECVKAPGALSSLSRPAAELRAVNSDKELHASHLALPTESQDILEASSNKISPKGLPRKRVKRRQKVGEQPNLVVGDAGRERKVPREGLPAGFDSLSAKEQRYILWCQEAARKYKKAKLMKEIEKRTDEGGDRHENIVAVLNLAIDQYQDAEKEPPWQSMEEIRTAALVPSLLALEATRQDPTLNIAIEAHEGDFQVTNFKPSAIAHGRASQQSELAFVKSMLEAKIHILEAIPIDENVRKTNFEILAEARRSQGAANADVSKENGRQGPRKGAKRPKQKAVAAAVSSQKTKDTATPRQPSLGKGKSNRKKRGLELCAPPSNLAQPENNMVLSYDQGQPYLPSVAAHTWLIPNTGTSSRTLALPKRKLGLIESITNKRQKRVSWKLAEQDQLSDVDTPSSISRPSQRLQVQTYEQQLQNISRAAARCYLGEVVNLLQVGKRGARRKSRLVVFRSARIKELACFTAQVERTEVEPQVRGQHQTKERGGDRLTEIVRDGVNTSNSSVINPQTRDSLIVRLRIKSKMVPLVYSQGSQQLQDDEPLYQGQPSSVYQNGPAFVLPKLVDPGQQPPRHAPKITKKRLGTKRKQISNKNSEGETYRTLQAPMTDDGGGFIATQNNDTSALESRIAKDLPSTPDVSIPTAQQDSHRSPLSNAFDNRNERSPASNEALSDPSIPGRQGCSPNLGTERLLVNDPGAQACLSRDVRSPHSDALDSANLGRHDLGAVQGYQQSSNTNTTSQNNIRDVPSTPHVDASSNGPLDSIYVGDELSHNALDGDALSSASPTDDTVIAQSDRTPESPDAETLVVAPEADDSGTMRTNASANLPRDVDHGSSLHPVPPSALDASSKSKGKIGIRKMKPQGGSIAAQRRKIVMDIIERCDGIYPGIAELSAPFKEQWTNSGYPGKAETKTLNAVIKYLCDSGKLRQLTFCFKDKRGLVVKKSMITKIEVSPTDPRVSEMQNIVSSKHPAWHIPGETGVSEEVRSKIWNPKGPMKNRTVKDLELEQEKVQLQQKPGYLERYELQEKSRQERKAEEERKTSALLTWMAEGKLPNGEDILDRSMFGPMNTASDRNRFLSFARRNMLNDPQGKVERLASLKSGRSARVASGHRQNPASTGQQASRKRSQATIRDEASKRLEELRKTGSSRLGNKLTFTHLLTVRDFVAGWKAQILEETLHEVAIERVSAANAADGIAHDPNVPSTQGQPLAEHQMAASEASQNMIFRLSKNGLSVVPDSDPELAELDRVRYGKGLGPGSHSWAARQQMYTIMEPEHIFHPSTGTFSVNFSAFRTARQIMQKYHWQRPIVKGFHDHVDDSERFELTAKGFEDIKFGDWPFINYTFPHSHTLLLDGKRKKQGLVYLDHRNRRQSRGVSNQISARSQRPSMAGSQTAKERRASATSTAPRPRPSSQVAVTPAKRKRSVAIEPFKTRRLTTPADLSLLFKPRTSENPLPEPGAGGRHRRAINGRRLQKLSSDFTNRLVTAVMVIRTLTGGVERNIDWVLVTKLFEPEWNQADIQKTWPKLLQTHRVQAEMIQVQFQPLFLKAYEKGLIPTIDYDKLQEYDWSWLVDWTIEHLDTPNDGVVDLPAHRNKLEEVFDMSTVKDDTSMSAFYELDVGRCSIRRREAELHKKAWIRSMSIKTVKASQPVVDHVAIAKTWIRANIATKEETYRPEFARDKIDRRFAKEVVDQAIKGLMGERVIVQLNKGRLQPKRNFDFNQQYLRRLTKNVDVCQFSRAPIFKRQLDKTLADGGEMIIPQKADDAFRLAMQNMQAHRRVSLIAKNPPMEKFGVGGVGNYRSRQIPMTKYYFDVALRATELYVDGNPLLPLPKAPMSPSAGADQEKIPLWYDINGDVIEDLWTLAVAAVMTVLVMRPGVSVHEIEPTVKPTLGLWEVQMLLDWMVEARAARKDGERYMAEEWWWLCLDLGKTSGDDKSGESNAETNLEEYRGDVQMEDV